MHVRKQFAMKDAVVIHSPSMDKLLNGCLVKLTAILIVFTNAANTTSTSIRAEGGVVWNLEPQRAGYKYLMKTENSQITSIGVNFSSTS